MGEKTVTLYPGNWLYNASVIGFLLSIEKVEGLNNKYFLLKDEGSLEIDKELFLNLDVNKRYFSTNKIAAITAKVKLYKNYLQKKWEEPFPFFVKSLYFLEEKAS
ncbi:MAG: hypothetical protein NZ841_07705, partial [Dictyoglomus sp.]|nr:hypothetical protein [Dictyoglomus sp.]MDW8189164.1 hypothetical protein [Dictyoglomus sp.]